MSIPPKKLHPGSVFHDSENWVADPTAREAKDGGYSWTEVKDAGYSLGEMKGAGSLAERSYGHRAAEWQPFNTPQGALARVSIILAQ